MKKICKNCKFWQNRKGYIYGRCTENENYISYGIIEHAADIITFEPDKDFGCNKWEVKEK